LILAIVGTAIAGSMILLSSAVASGLNNAATIVQSRGASAPRNPNAGPGNNSGNGNTTPGVPGAGFGH
jgi:hypothetical protein